MEFLQLDNMLPNFIPKSCKWKKYVWKITYIEKGNDHLRGTPVNFSKVIWKILPPLG